MGYTEEQLNLIQWRKPELIKKPEPSLNDAIVEFLKIYEVFVEPPKDKSSLDGAISGAVTGFAGANAGGNAFLISGQKKQTQVQEWTQWKQWALDHKEFPKFQTDFFNEIHEYNANIDKKLKDPEFQKEIDKLFIEEEQKNKEVEKTYERIAIFGGVVFLIIIILNVYSGTEDFRRNRDNSYIKTQINLVG